MTDRISAYSVFLSTNVSREQPLPINFTPGFQHVEIPYSPRITKDIGTFEKVCDEAAKSGFNKLLIFTGDALVYDSHPEIALPGAWTKDELKYQIDRIRSLGMEPIPMLDFSAAHDVWMGEYSKMVSTPEYYRVQADLIAELCELFGQPSLFWLGMSGETAEVQRLFGLSVIRDPLLMAHDIAYLISECRKHGARPWLCGDLALTDKELFLRTVDRDVLISGFYVSYISMRRLKLGTFKVPDLEIFSALEPYGYSFTPALSAYRLRDFVPSLIPLLKERVDRGSVKGFVRLTFFVPNKTDEHKLYYEAQINPEDLRLWDEA